MIRSHVFYRIVGVISGKQKTHSGNTTGLIMSHITHHIRYKRLWESF